MPAETTKTLRTQRQWLKITRNAEQRYFAFAIGWAGEPPCRELEPQRYPFTFMSTWTDAIAHAERRLRDHEPDCEIKMDPAPRRRPSSSGPSF